MSDTTVKIESATEKKIEKKKHTRGMGFTYQRGSTWWIYYSHRGKEYRESSHSEKPADATALLKKRLGEIGRGKLIGPTEEKVTFEDLAADFERERALKARKSDTATEVSQPVQPGEPEKPKLTKGEKGAKQRVAHLRRFFGFDRAVDCTTSRIRGYQDSRLREGASPATINRDLAALSRMFTLAIQSNRLSSRPHIPHLDEPQARQGFFEHGNMLAVRNHLPDEYQDILDFAYLTGWRKGQILRLEWTDVDLVAGVIRVAPERTKNRTAHVVALAGPLLDVIERRRAARTLTTQRVFHTNGRRINSFNKRWKTACKDAGVPGMLFHDLRRTAVRNLERAGVPRSAAMAITGHKTESVYRRYAIVAEEDTREGMARVGAYVATLRTDATVQPIAAASGAKRRARK